MIENKFDIYEPPHGHEERFLQKLTQKNTEMQHPPKVKKHLIRKMLHWSGAIAASVIVMLWLLTKETTSLEKISKTAYQSEQYYLPLIQKNIKIIKSYSENEKLTKDALHQLEKMNKHYLEIRQKIIMEGQNKQLLNAMVVNFDTQLTFSNNIIAMIPQKHTL